MDLGLSALTDDQLLELVKQACGELAVRDPFCRRLAQLGITDAADTLQLKREALKKAVLAEREKYIKQINADVLQMVREGVADGTVRLLTPSQEGRIIAEADMVAKIKCIDETAMAIQQGALGKKNNPGEAWQNASKTSGHYLEYQKRRGWESNDIDGDYNNWARAEEQRRAFYREMQRLEELKQAAYDQMPPPPFYIPKVKP